MSPVPETEPWEEARKDTLRSQDEVSDQRYEEHLARRDDKNEERNDDEADWDPHTSFKPSIFSSVPEGWLSPGEFGEYLTELWDDTITLNQVYRMMDKYGFPWEYGSKNTRHGPRYVIPVAEAIDFIQKNLEVCPAFQDPRLRREFDSLSKRDKKRRNKQRKKKKSGIRLKFRLRTVYPEEVREISASIFQGQTGYYCIGTHGEAEDVPTAEVTST